jgi:VanZ family protein
LNLFVFLAYAAAVALLSLMPADGVGPGGWDKLAHFGCYALFTLLAFRVTPRQPGFLGLCIGIIGFGGALEYMQSLTPGRMMSGYDFGANMLGVVVGAAAARRFARQVS